MRFVVGRVGVGRWWGAVVGCLIFMHGVGVCVTGVVEALPGRVYFETVRKELDRASSSIVVCMYSFTFRPQLADSPVFALAQSLRKAHDRGVHVEVLLRTGGDMFA